VASVPLASPRYVTHAGLEQGSIVSQSRGGRRPVTFGGSRTIGGGLAIAAVSAAAIGVLAGCGGSGGPAAVGATRSATATAGNTTPSAPAATQSAAATASPAGTGATAAAPATAVAFVPVTEPFDPGHPAHAMSAPADCGSQDSTVAIEQCFEAKTETADAAIDAARQASFTSASAAQQTAINAADSGWLAARATVCEKAYQTGGTIDGINIAGCLLAESSARLNALKGITPPQAVLKSTDSTSLSDVSWYTAADGTRIGMIDTQGDATGGAVIAWVVIAGSDGFVVNPARFYYSDGTFFDAGTVQGANPNGHRVAPGTEYQFSVDYSHLSTDPHPGNSGWDYAPAPGAPAAVWR
jgi:uncharacterized protein YecT (DUF1311 family)